METIDFRDLGKVACKIVEGKEVLFDKDGNPIDERNTYVVDYNCAKTPIENWELRCTCKYHDWTFGSWGKDAKGLDILICTLCFRRFSQCSFCLEEEDAPRFKSESDGEYNFSCWRCWLPEEKKREKLKLQFEENKVMRKMLRKEGRISDLEEKTKNLVDKLLCESYEVLVVSKDKIVFCKNGGYCELYGLKSVTQEIVLYSAYPETKILTRFRHSLDYKKFADIKYPLVDFNKEETKITVWWFDNTKETKVI